MADNVTSKDIITWNDIRNLKLWSLSIILILLTLTTIAGNIFVIYAILQEKALKTIGNYLILSLAITDLLVACVVMPIATIYEISGEWQLGTLLCDLWLFADVLCSTSSILHLVAIAFDRYFAITNIDYIHNRSKAKIGVMILIAWLVSAVVSLAPILGWKDAGFNDRVNNEKKCLYSQNKWYQVFATFFSFYGPVIFVLYLYFRIYQETKRRIRRKRDSSQAKYRCKRNATNRADEFSYESNQEVTFNVTTADSTQCPAKYLENSASKYSSSVERFKISTVSGHISSIASDSYLQTIHSTTRNNNGTNKSNSPIRIHSIGEPSPTKIGYKCEESAAASKVIVPRKPVSLWTGLRNRLHFNYFSDTENREKKAAKILTIITMTFVVCWLPFFICALLMPFFPRSVPELAFSVCLWLGWVNSTLNPIIYTIFSPEFRRAFNRMLSCC